MNNYRITVNCQMRNTETQQAALDKGFKYVLDHTRDYTEYRYVEAENASKAYQFARNEVKQQTNRSYGRDQSFGFRFNQPKTDITEGGQAQESLLPKRSKARQFFDKWDNLHLERLGDLEFSELLKDIETLKDNYYFITDIDFDKQKSLSMTIPTKYNRFGGNKQIIEL